MTAGAATMYQSMSALGFAKESSYRGPVDLSGAPPGASVLILGAGLAGLVAAYELRRAGYKVRVLEYNQRAGGRSWTLRGGDEYTELGGFKQRCEFDPGLYINPGPWRLPYHHYGMLDYAKRFSVPLEPFNGLNFNAYLHSQNNFGGKPPRFGGDPRRQRNAARVAAKLGPARQGFPLRCLATRELVARLRQGPRRRPERRTGRLHSD